MSPRVVQVGGRVSRRGGVARATVFRRIAGASADVSRRAVGGGACRRDAVDRVAVSRRAPGARATVSRRAVVARGSLRGAVDRAAVSRRATCVEAMRSRRGVDAAMSRTRSALGPDVARRVDADASRWRAGVLGEVSGGAEDDVSGRDGTDESRREGVSSAARVRGRGARGGTRPDARTGGGSIRPTSAPPILTAESVPAGYWWTATAYSRGRSQTQREPPATVPAAPHSSASKRTATGYGLVFSTTRWPAEGVRFVSSQA